MSLSSTTSRVSATITALPQTIPVTFPFIQAADLGVSDGAVLLTLSSDYTVTGGGYNGANQMQTGSITVASGGTGNVQVNDVITIYRNVSPTQTTSFASTGLQTPLMIEQDDDKLTTLVQELLGMQYNPFPLISGAPNLITLGWITAQTGGITTSIDSLNVTAIPTNELPLVIAVSISDDLEIWKLRPMQMGDPSATTLPNFIVPVTNPNNLIWRNVSPSLQVTSVPSGQATINFGTVNAGVRSINSTNAYPGVAAGSIVVASTVSATTLAGLVFLQPYAPAANTITFYCLNTTAAPIVVGSVVFNWVAFPLGY